MSVDFYETNGQDYYQSTVYIDMNELYIPFLSRLPKGGHILDAGCGSGRDSKAFLEQGYSVTAIDASMVMVELSSRLIGQPTLHLKFQELRFDSAFDGIWACASLLHVPLNQINGGMQRLTTALKVGGIFYMSFKLGDGVRMDGDRLFVDYNEDSLRRLLSHHQCLQLKRMWRTDDKKLGCLRDCWLNALASKV
ncbi:class I SAM-dependent methyltransferase [Oculatella sp. FACHB-28]|uniref:class I SAM-dependent methyltransferase n=1 Tax=Oculatella sp. FACHB-28 TaxID=2692845 RepID=UPI001688B875|nr:class I SAM-dependent methyltransferase [Oculatella sp. FACHB-28]MBD2058117.1 class I SAM-dependent methyltransferase [Oculatella sp. FACHB-28]